MLTTKAGVLDWEPIAAGGADLVYNGAFPANSPYTDGDIVVKRDRLPVRAPDEPPRRRRGQGREARRLSGTPPASPVKGDEWTLPSATGGLALPLQRRLRLGVQVGVHRRHDLGGRGADHRPSSSIVVGYSTGRTDRAARWRLPLLRRCARLRLPRRDGVDRWGLWYGATGPIGHRSAYMIIASGNRPRVLAGARSRAGGEPNVAPGPWHSLAYGLLAVLLRVLNCTPIRVA